MGYTQNDGFLVANDGWVFQPKFTTGVLPKMIFADSLDNYDLIHEPEIEETEVPDDGESADPV